MYNNNFLYKSRILSLYREIRECTSIYINKVRVLSHWGTRKPHQNSTKNYVVLRTTLRVYVILESTNQNFVQYSARIGKTELCIVTHLLTLNESQDNFMLDLILKSDGLRHDISVIVNSIKQVGLLLNARAI